MKELSLEQKAKRYDEAIERAKSKLHYPDRPCFVNVIEIFPELKESGDEKIRKELLSFFTERAKYTEDSTFNGLSSKEIIAWLEKQGEQNAWSEEDKNRFNNLIFLVEHSDENEATKEGFIKFINKLKSLRPQPKQELTQDDEQYLLICKNALRKYQVSDKWDAEIIIRWLENKLNPNKD